MPPPLPQLHLLPWSGHPWRWEEDDTVLVWEDGTTLSFLDELEAMGRCATQGRLPSLPCVALILGGCRGKAPGFNAANAHGIPLGTLLGAAAVLRKLQALPPDLLTVAGKAAIIEMVSDAQPLPTYFVADAIRDWRELPEARDAHGNPEPVGALMLRISQSLAGITPESIRSRMKTGLEALPQKAELDDLELTTSVRELLSLLKDDAGLAGIAALARDVMAALTFPRRPEEDTELPEGGFSDLTNRGSPDRLLLSELAADPLMLAVRVSLNEALYLRRETPRQSRPRAVAVLVDTGLRLWGLPRPFAWAVALALLAKQEGAARLTLWCTQGGKVLPMKLASAGDLSAALERLDPGADPVPALGHFFEAVADWQQSAESATETDYFFITHPDTLTEPGFWRVAETWPPLHLALVDQEGQLTLEQRSRSGRSELARARLKLDSLVGEPAAKAARTGPREPLILEQRPFPLRIAARGRVTAACAAGVQAWCAITEPRQWVYWKAGDTASQLLAHSIPKGRVVWMDYGDEDTAYALFTEDKGISTLVRSQQGEVTALTLETKERPLHARRFGTVLVVVTQTSVVAFNLENGRELSHQAETFQLVSPVFSGRFFKNAFMWCSLTWDGSTASYHRLLWAGAAQSIILAFENVQGIPHALYSDGRLMNHEVDNDECLSSHEIDPSAVVTRITSGGLPGDITKATLSQDGSRLVVEFGHLDAAVWLLEEKRLIRGIRNTMKTLLAGQAPPGSGSFVNVTRLAFTGAYGLALQLNGKHWHHLQTTTAAYLHWSADTGGQTLLKIVELQQEDASSPAWRGTATWPSGACILLDHHGMLHFMPATSDLPEMCLTTGGGHMGFWSSDGVCSGSGLLVPPHDTTTATSSQVAQMILNFAVHALKE